MRILVLAGAAAAALGALFHLQGRSLAGPEQSFMYASPEWEVNGLLIVAAGAAAIVAGLVRR